MAPPTSETVPLRPVVSNGYIDNNGASSIKEEELCADVFGANPLDALEIGTENASQLETEETGNILLTNPDLIKEVIRFVDIRVVKWDWTALKLKAGGK